MFKRAKASKIVLIAALGGSLAPTAFARPAKPVAKKATVHAAVAHHTAGHAVQAHVAWAHAVPARVGAHAVSAPNGRKENGRKESSRLLVAAKMPGRHSTRTVKAATIHAPVSIHTQATIHTPTAYQQSQPTTIAAQPAPSMSAPTAAAETMPASASDLAVRHDRKHHLAPVDPGAGTKPANPGSAPAVVALPGNAAGNNGGQPNAAVATATPVLVEAALFTKSGRLIVPPAMKGSHDILVHQNVMADQDGLARIQDDDDLEQMRLGRTLLPLPESAAMQSDERLPLNRRYARPWTVKFLEALAKAHYERFHTALQVNSAVRTVEFQRGLMRVNGNAAPAEGETASPHLTGQAVDLAKKGLSMTEIAWMRGYLLPLVQQGKVDVEEEFQQSCFHVSVYRKYVPEPPPGRVIAGKAATGSALAVALR